MRGITRACVVLAMVVLPSTVALAADEVEVSELVQNSAEYAGREISIEGELVGDYGFRDDGWMWTQLNGDVYVESPLREGGAPAGGNVGIGVRMPTRLAASLDPPGGYRQRGPIVQVVGVWKYNNAERQGETFFEVSTITVIEPGRPLHEDPNWPALATGVILLMAALGTWVVTRSSR
jgi:hypothetical protein